jgi:hypothetical protein
VAHTVDTLRNSILSSIHGRRLGLDKDEFLVGPKALKKAYQAIDPASLTSSVSTTGTEVANHGYTSLAVATQAATTGSSYGTTEVGGVYAMAAPAPGVEKVLFTSTAHSTMLITVSFGPGVTAQNTSAGSTFGGVSFNARGQWCRLIGLTTDRWLMAGISTCASLAAT